MKPQAIQMSGLKNTSVCAHIVLLLTLTGCPICPDGTLPIVEGELPVVTGGSLQFAMVYGGDRYEGDSACDLYWYVNEIEGGSEEFGVIDSCGHYTAPVVKPSEEVWIASHQYQAGTCYDCCPSAQRQITIVD